jgi:acyl transferase domain-containing protein
MDHKFEIDSDSAPNGNFTDTNGHNTPTPSASSNGSQPNGHTSQGMPPFTPIAICGMACRLPGGIASPQELWEFLEAKGDARSRVPDSRYNIDTYHSPSRKPGTVISEHGYFLDESVDLGVLDTSLFSGPRKELERLDPQQRLLLEVAREALDDSGEVGWKGSNMGVYVGSYGQDWYDLFHRETQSYGYEISVTNDFMISSRLSYEMDLHGPRYGDPAIV